MSGFKLLGIQILDKCFYEARKILPVKQLYQFYANYYFEENVNQEVISIKVDESKEINLYGIQRDNQDDLLINISAIVGKNGSGKSTILELFYAFCLCICKEQADIKVEIEKLKKSRPAQIVFIQSLFNNLRVEVFYETVGTVKSIQYLGSEGIKGFTFNPLRTNNTSFNLTEFCYTIAINYSLYGLNETNTPWLTPMFHKNDGYQGPLVINPFREEGNIDVNSEYHLTNARLIQNLSLYEEPNPEIINGQRLDKIQFSFQPKELDYVYFSGTEYDLNETINHYESSTSNSIYDLINQLTSALVNDIIQPGTIAIFNQLKRSGTSSNIKNYIIDITTKNGGAGFIEFWFTRYMIRKVFKIFLQYSWLRDKYITFSEYNNHPVMGIKEGMESDLIKYLLGDKSHITLKLRQTIFMWKSRYFFDKVIWGKMTNENFPEYFACVCAMNSTALIEAASKALNKKTLKETFDLENVPGGILKPEIYVNRTDTDMGQGKIEKLSSGEQQFLFTMQSIIYHLKNINSVHETEALNRESIVRYNNVIIILDEVELYFHPDLQRKFIHELLQQIGQIDISNIKSINILFSTHSPFLLSDIQSNNILKMKNGIGLEHKENEQTFGANVHDLLANDFFLENGFMGQYAEYIIKDLALYLSDTLDTGKMAEINWNEESAKLTISIVGEPLLKVRLESLYDKKFVEHDKLLIQRRIEELQAKLQK